MILPVELLSEVISFYLSSSPSRKSLSPLTLSSSLLRTLSLKTFYLSLSIPLSLSKHTDWIYLLGHSSISPFVRSLTLKHHSAFQSILHALPRLRTLRLPLVNSSPNLIPLIERITWIPPSLRELEIYVDHAFGCGIGAIWDTIGKRINALEKLRITFVWEFGGEGNFREIARLLAFSSLTNLPHIHSIELSIPLYSCPQSEEGERETIDTLQTLTHTLLFDHLQPLRQVIWLFKEQSHTITIDRR